MLTNVCSIKPGSKVYFHGHPCIVLGHRAEGTLLIMEGQIKARFGDTNNFAESSLREYLNGEFLNELTDGHPEDVLTRTVDLTAVNGAKKYGSCQCKLAPLTFDEIRRFHGLLPKPREWEWSVTPWSPLCTEMDNIWVMGFNTNGDVNGRTCASIYSCRPAFLVSSQYALEVDYGLNHYTTNELIAEVNRRMNEKD